MLDRLKKLLGECRPHLLPVLLLCITAFAIYGRILRHEFLSNWDDNRYILENPDVLGLSWARVYAVFSKYYVGNYAPIQMLSYMFDHAVWGIWAGGYLLTNLLVHILNGILLYRLLLRFVGVRLAAWCGALLFLIHPVQVETVVWISQRKNLLAMLFFLLAWEFYLAYRESTLTRRRLFYVASLIALLLALLSKSVAVIFPLVIFLFDACYPSATVRFRFLDKGPYLLIAIGGAVLAIISQTPDYTEWGAGGGRTGYHGGSALATFLTMLPVFCKYLRLIVWPFNLSALYDPEIHKSIDVAVLAAFILLCCICCLIYRLYRFDRRIAFWAIFFYIALLPVSQIVPLVTLINDRYLYFPMIGAAGLMAYVVKKVDMRSFIVLAYVSVLLFFSSCSLLRIDVWRNGITLWHDTVRNSPKLPQAWEALGEACQYSANPNLEEAKKAYLQTIKLNQDSDISRYNLGVLYMDQNDLASADKILRELLQRNPKHVMGLAAFGDLALHRFEYKEAERYYRNAVALQPEAIQVHHKIGNLMIIVGRLDEARRSYLRIEEIQWSSDPLNAYELAKVEAISGDTSASIKWLEVALQRGYNNFAGIMSDEELTPVKSDGRFADLVNKYFPKL